MNRLTTRLVLALAVLGAGCLAAGCAQGGALQGGTLAAAVARSSSDPSQSPDASASESPPASPTLTFSPPPRTRSPRPTAQASTTAPAPAPVASTETSAESPTPTPTESAAAQTGSGSGLIWLWIVLGVIVVAVVTALIARRSGRRSAVSANWSAKVAEVSAKGAALYDAMSLAEAQGTLLAADATGRSADIERRADDLTQTLYALRETAPNEMERTRVADVLATLQALRSAINAERNLGGDPAQAAGRIHSLLVSFDAALRALRSPTDYRL